MSSPSPKASAEVEQRCISILQKEPAQRSEDDIETLYEWISGLNCSFFDDNTESINRDLCRCMQYEHVPANTTLFNQGDVSDKLYVIVRGAVGIWVTIFRDAHEYPKPQGLSKLQQLHEKEKAGKIITPSLNRLTVERRTGRHNKGKAKPAKISILPEADEKKDVAPKGIDIFVGFVRAGGPTTSFGELGLIGDKGRSATVRTDLEQACEFLTIDKDDFDKVLKSHFNEILDAKVNQMKTFPIFENVGSEHLTYVSLHLKRQTFGPNHLLLKQGTTAHEVVFIIEGKVRSERIVMEAPAGKQRGSGRHSLRFSQQPKYETLRTFQSGDTLGALEALAEKPQKLPHTYRTVTDCEVFVVQRDDLLNRLQTDVVKRFLAEVEASQGQEQGASSSSSG